MQALITWFNTQSIYIRSFLALIVLPTFVAGGYYGLFVSDIFVSEARFAVRTGSPSISTDLFNTIVSGSGSASEDAIIVRDYILSHDLMTDLDRRLGIRAHYSSADIDLFSRFDVDETNEEFLNFFRKKIEIRIDAQTNITTLRVKAFDAAKAQEIANAIIELSEALVNRISERIVDDSLVFARTEVDESETRIKAANKAITDFRSTMNSINPGEETSAVLRIVTELEGRLAESRAELIQAENFMSADSPQVLNIRNKVNALALQITNERQRLTSGKDSVIDYTSLIDTYEPLALEKELARQFYASALASLEVARAEAQLKQRYLLLFVRPQIPDKAIEPERVRSTLIIFAALCIIYAISGLVWAAIKDHMRL